MTLLLTVRWPFLNAGRDKTKFKVLHFSLKFCFSTLIKLNWGFRFAVL